MTRQTTFALRDLQLFSQVFTEAYTAYIASLIAQVGGGDWPLNDADTEVVADNRANRDATGSTNLLTNGDFESWASSTNANNWTESLAGTSAVNQETSVIHGGANAARCEIDGSNNIAALTQAITTVTGKTYRLSSWAKVNDATGGPTARVDFSSLAGPALALTTSYVQRTSRRVATSTSPSLILNRNSAASKSIYWDDVTVVEDGDGDLILSLVGLTLAQAGEDGVTGKAIDVNGSTGVATLTDRAEWRGLTNFMWGGVFNPDATGANDRLIFKSGEFDVIFNADGTISVTVNYDTTNATCTTSTTFSTGSWQGIAGGISSADKLPRVYKNGVECAYASQDAGVGTRVSNTNSIQWFKDGGANGYDGKAQKLFLLKTAPTAALAANLYALRNVS